MKKRLTEEEYASNINVGTFRTNDEAVRFLNYLRQKQVAQQGNYPKN